MSFLNPDKRDDEVGDDLDRLMELCEPTFQAADKLTEWELEFLCSLAERLEKYGERTFVSPKQWEVIERIEAKIAQRSLDL